MATRKTNAVRVFKNLIINGGFDFVQRGVDSSFTATAKTFVFDRWISQWSSGGGTGTVQRLNSPNLQNATKSINMVRNNGNGSTNGLNLVQGIESSTVTTYQGRRMMFSFWSRTAQGAGEYTANNNELQFLVKTGTGIDQSPEIATTYTGEVIHANTLVSVTDDWTQFKFAFTMPTNSREMRVQFKSTHVGTAGSNDGVDIGNVMVHEGDSPILFQRAGANLAEELFLAQRYYEKSYALDTVPGTATGTNVITLSGRVASATTIDHVMTYAYKTTKRISPSMIIWDDAGASGKMKDSSNNSITTTPNTGTKGFTVSTTSASGLTAADAQSLGGHFAADAEI